MKKIVVGISGATGVIYGVRLLEALHQLPDIETHLVVSDYGYENLKTETGCSADYINRLSSFVYDNHNLGARISSGSFSTDAMVILPCSMKTLSSIANGFCDNLIARAADVTIKEGRPLILCPRETPLNAIHLGNMLKLSQLGVAMIPPMPAFYNRPQTIDDIINHQIMKIFDYLKLPFVNGKRWNG